MNDENNYEVYDGDDDVDVWSVEEGIDTDGDGVIDALITDYDTNTDGYIDAETVEIDLDGDGIVDFATYAEDLDYDGNVDVVVTEADSNFDTVVDYVDINHITYDDDGNPSEFHTTAIDTDFDGQFDEFDYQADGFGPTDDDDVIFEEPAQEDDIVFEEPEDDVYFDDSMDDEPVYEEPEEVMPPVYEEPAEDEDFTFDEPEEDDLIYDEPSEEDDSVYVEPEEPTEDDVIFDEPEEDDIIYDEPADEDIVPESDDSEEDSLYPFEVTDSEDLNNDGEADEMTAEIDLDGDGDADGLVYAKDLDFDGKADVIVTRMDTDGDGDYDMNSFSLISNHEDGSSSEFFVVAQDLDNDGQLDSIDYGSYNYSAEDNEGFNIFDILSGGEDIDVDADDPTDFDDPVDSDDLTPDSDIDDIDPATDEDDSVLLPEIPYDSANDNGVRAESLDNFDPADADQEGVMGDPEEALDFWEFQGNTMRCAIYSQKFAIEEYLGREVPIEELVDIAIENDWYVEGQGTPVIYMDKLLDYYGVPNEVTYDNTIESLAESLNDGHRVIVSVDAEEYWYAENDGDMYVPGDGINHAIEVIGVDTSDPDNVVVIVNDSGTPNGQGLEIPVETFMDAWEDGDCHMIVC